LVWPSFANLVVSNSGNEAVGTEGFTRQDGDLLRYHLDEIVLVFGDLIKKQAGYDERHDTSSNTMVNVAIIDPGGIGNFHAGSYP